MSIKGDNSGKAISEITDNLSSLRLSSRDILVFEAQIAEQACRFDEMAMCMKKVVEMTLGDVTAEELKLFSSAFKNKIRARRTSWKIVIEQIKKELVAERFNYVLINQRYLNVIEAEIRSISNEILEILEKYLRPSIISPGLMKVFFYKMKGDYHRYLAEFSIGNEKQSMIDNCRSAYNAALNLAYSELTPVHLLRLNLLLNVGVFHYEILGDPETATRLASSAFREAVPLLPTLKEQGPTARESLSALILLKDYYVFWSTHLKDQGANIYEDSYVAEDLIEP